jgi:acyl-CoA reductase-like NAD-dependent aldehyde dehydrogenase
VQTSSRIAREEIFGPVLSVLTFRTPAEAIAKANNTPYGLSAGIWTDKGSRILAVADQLRAGVIWANTFNRFDPSSPFGGYKESGYGREGGRHGLAAYLAPRAVSAAGRGAAKASLAGPATAMPIEAADGAPDLETRAASRRAPRSAKPSKRGAAK